MSGLVCRKCGVDTHGCGGYLARVNPRGQPGVWECRPVCGSDLPPDTRLLLAIEGDEQEPEA